MASRYLITLELDETHWGYNEGAKQRQGRKIRHVVPDDVREGQRGDTSQSSHVLELPQIAVVG